jgi:hypothetical protein
MHRTRTAGAERECAPGDAGGRRVNRSSSGAAHRPRGARDLRAGVNVHDRRCHLRARRRLRDDHARGVLRLLRIQTPGDERRLARLARSHALRADELRALWKGGVRPGRAIFDISRGVQPGTVWPHSKTVAARAHPPSRRARARRREPGPSLRRSGLVACAGSRSIASISFEDIPRHYASFLRVSWRLTIWRGPDIC